MLKSGERVSAVWAVCCLGLWGVQGAVTEGQLKSGEDSKWYHVSRRREACFPRRSIAS